MSREAWASPRQRRRIEAALIERDGLACAICARPIDPDQPRPSPLGLSIDHITPRSAGGTNTLDNLRLAHHGCNASRGVGFTSARRAPYIASWSPLVRPGPVPALSRPRPGGLPLF